MHDEEANMFDPPMDAMSYEDELRAKLDDAERLVEVLKAECRAWRAFEAATEDEGVAPKAAHLYYAAQSARAATDAALGKEGL